MLSVFPSLLSLQQLSPLLIRLILGLVIAFEAYRVYSKGSISLQQKSLSILEAIAGILLIIGLWTQIAALFVAIDLIIRLAYKIKSRNFLSDGINYYLILLVLAISLLFTGAGFLAFDMPL